MKPKYRFLVGGLIIFAVIGAVAVQGLQQMTVYFYTPQEILADTEEFQDKLIRIGALVEPGSVDWDADNIQLAFRVTEDSQHFIPVYYEGVKPDMFREGQGVVVEGKMNGDTFHAETLLVKHSEEYRVDPQEHQAKKDYYKTLSE